MNMFTNSKKTKKFILVLVLLILFNFCYPKNVHAWLGIDDLAALPLKIFYEAFKGVYIVLNNLFTESSKSAQHGRVSSVYNASALVVYLTPENIIKGKFLIFDPDLFKDVSTVEDSNYDKYYDDGIVENRNNRENLRNTIAGWYYGIRNFAIVGLLSVLVYVGIRMIISTVAQDKAKYKIMFKDWLVAACLVVLMHYIMISILNISSLITDAIGTSGENADMISIYTERISGMLSEKYDEPGTLDNSYKYKDSSGNVYTISDGYGYIIVLYGVLIYTIIFTIKYLKRMFTIMFLILLGPIACITYPIDKISDGKAQAFNKWFSEFLYQVIIQPFHLLLYIVLIGTASEFADKNVVYSIICFAVMIPAEKFVKEMFGFKDKLGSPLSAAGAGAMGAMASKAMHALMSGGKKGSAGSADKVEKDKDTSSQLPPRTVDRNNLVSGNGGGDAEENNNRQIGNGNSDNTQTGDGSNPAIGAGDGSNPAIGAGDESETSIDAGDGNDSEEGTPPVNSAETEEQGYTPLGAREGANNADAKQLDNKGMSKWDKIRATHNMSVAKKHGETKRWKRNIKRGGKALKAIGKFGLNAAGRALKVGAVATVAGIGATAAIMTGNGKEALGLVSGALGYAGKNALGLGRDAVNGGKRAIKNAAKGRVTAYKNALRKDTGKGRLLKSKEELAFKKFMSDPKEMDKAEASYMVNHNGQPPVTGKQLENEMRDRFELARYGFKDDQIDKAVGEYQKLKDPKIGGLSKEDALNQTAYATQLSEDYSKKDFRSKKTMEEARDTIAQKFIDEGANPKIAQAEAERYLGMAARIKGTEIALPNANRRPSTGSGAQPRSNAGQTTQTVNQTVDLPVDREPLDVSNPLGVEEADRTEEQMKIINNLTVRLQNAGYSNDEIKGIAEGCKSSQYGATHAIATYKTKVEILTDKGLQEQARAYVASSSGVDKKEITDSQVRVEMERRVEFFADTKAQDQARQYIAESKNISKQEVTSKDVRMEMERRVEIFTDTKAQNHARAQIASSTGTSESEVTKQQINAMLEKRYEFFADTKVQDQAREYVASSMNISPQNVSDKQLRTEMGNRFELVSAGANVKNLDSIRANDSRKYAKQTQSDKQRALDVATRFSAKEMGDATVMDKEIFKMAKELKKEKGISVAEGRTVAKEIVDRAAGFKGTKAIYTED